MKVFISWSDAKSRAMAAALAETLPVIINAVEPFFSQEIEKGTAGDHEIHSALEGTGFGIICLTSQNLQSPWMHYEAGALAKSGERVWTLLLDIAHAEVKPPLSRFQHTTATRDDFFKLVESINANLASAGDKPLHPVTLRTSFDRSWPELERALDAARSIGNKRQAHREHRPDRELLEEILSLLRSRDIAREGLGAPADVAKPNFIAFGVNVNDQLTSRVVSLLKALGVKEYEAVSNGLIALFDYRQSDTVPLRLHEAGATQIFGLAEGNDRRQVLKDALYAMARRRGVTALELLSTPVEAPDPSHRRSGPRKQDP